MKLPDGTEKAKYILENIMPKVDNNNYHIIKTYKYPSDMADLFINI